MPTTTPRLGLSKPAPADLVSVYPAAVGPSFDLVDSEMFRRRGAWSGATAYAINDVVTRNGTTYIAIAASTNVTPPKAATWQLMSIPLGTLNLLDYVTADGTDEATGLNAALTAARAGNLELTAPPGTLIGIGSQVILANSDTLYFASESCTLRILPTFDWTTVAVGEGAVQAKSPSGSSTVHVKGLRVDGNALTNAIVPESKGGLVLSGLLLSTWERGYVGYIKQLNNSKAMWIKNCNTFKGDVRVEDNGGTAVCTGLEIEGSIQVEMSLSCARQAFGHSLYLRPQTPNCGWAFTGLIDECTTAGYESVVVDPLNNEPLDVSFRGMVFYSFDSAYAVKVLRGSQIVFQGCTIGPFTGRTNAGGLRVLVGSVKLADSRCFHTGTGQGLVVLPGAEVVDGGGNTTTTFVGNGSYLTKSRQLQLGTGAVITGHTSAVVVWDPPSVLTGAFTSTTMTITGARAGDVATAAMETALPAGMIVSAAVTARDVVTVTLLNMTGGTVDLAAGDLRVDIWQHHNTFSPYAIESYVQGFIADGITGLVNNDPVVTWTADKGANATTPGGAGTQPLYITGWQNGLPCVRGDGVNDWMEMEFDFPDAFTMFVVGKKRTNVTPSALCVVAQRSAVSGQNATPCQFQWQTSNIPRAFFQDDAALTLNAPDTVARFGSAELYTIKKTQDLGAGDALTLYRNGVQVGTQTAGRGIPTGATRTTMFAMFITGAIGRFSDYDLGELLVCNISLGDTIRQQTEAFLTDKWAL